MDKKNKFPMFAIIMLCIGVGLILFGIIAPSKMFSGNNTYVVELDRSGFDDMKLRITLNTNEEINSTITALVHEDEFYIIVKKVEDGVYKGSASIDRDEYFMSRESDVMIKVSGVGGNAIKFRQDTEFWATSGKIVLTILPIFFGAFICMMGLALGLTIRHRNGLKKAFSGTVGAVAGAVGTISRAIKQKNDEKYCEYCECYNEKDAQKCKYCGAPLKNYKMEE
jgi:hypothetical protein